MEMKLSIIVSAVVAIVTAQTFGDIPPCAQPCLTKMCDKNDSACICNSLNSNQGEITSCITQACGQQATIGML